MAIVGREFFNRSIPGGRRPVRQDMWSTKRAKSVRHWLVGWYHWVQKHPVHGVGLPLNESLRRIISAPNPLTVKFLKPNHLRG